MKKTANSGSLATIPKAFRQCAACANDHSFRFVPYLEIKIFNTYIIIGRLKINLLYFDVMILNF